MNDRLDIHERHRPFVFVDDAHLDLASSELAKQAIAHPMRSPNT